MKLLCVALALALTTALHAQKGNNQIGIAAEGALPVGNTAQALKPGYGGSLKGSWGTGTSGQATLTAGYLTPFKNKWETSTSDTRLRLISLMAGYRHRFGGFFAEPQAGYGALSYKWKDISPYAGNGGTHTSTLHRFGWALGTGYVTGRTELGVRYQEFLAGRWSSAHRNLVLRLGYNFGGEAAGR